MFFTSELHARIRAEFNLGEKTCTTFCISFGTLRGSTQRNESKNLYYGGIKIISRRLFLISALVLDLNFIEFNLGIFLIFTEMLHTQQSAHS